MFRGIAVIFTQLGVETAEILVKGAWERQVNGLAGRA